MEAVTTNTITVIFKFIAAIIAMFSPPPEPLAQGELPLALVSASEEVSFGEVQFSIETDEYAQTYIKGNLDPENAALLAELTGRHVGENLDFVVCGRTIMSPRVMVAITGGRFQISGPEQVSTIVNMLQNGCP